MTVTSTPQPNLRSPICTSSFQTLRQVHPHSATLPGHRAENDTTASDHARDTRSPSASNAHLGAPQHTSSAAPPPHTSGSSAPSQRLALHVPPLPLPPQLIPLAPIAPRAVIPEPFPAHPRRHPEPRTVQRRHRRWQRQTRRRRRPVPTPSSAPAPETRSGPGRGREDVEPVVVWWRAL